MFVGKMCFGKSQDDESIYAHREWAESVARLCDYEGSLSDGDTCVWNQIRWVWKCQNARRTSRGPVVNAQLVAEE